MYPIWGHQEMTGWEGGEQLKAPSSYLWSVTTLQGVRHGEIRFPSPSAPLSGAHRWQKNQLKFHFQHQGMIHVLFLQTFLPQFLPIQFVWYYLDSSFHSFLFLLNLKQVVNITYMYCLQSFLSFFYVQYSLVRVVIYQRPIISIMIIRPIDQQLA